MCSVLVSAHVHDYTSGDSIGIDLFPIDPMESIGRISNPSNCCRHFRFHVMTTLPVTKCTRLFFRFSCTTGFHRTPGCVHRNLFGSIGHDWILEVLIRFRAHTVVLTADIEKAFLNVAIAPEHRDYLRFLWIDDILEDDPQLLVMRFGKVVFGVSSSPFLAMQLSASNWTPTDLRTQISLMISYVEGLANSKPDQASAYEFYTKLKSRFQEGGFNMRKW